MTAKTQIELAATQAKQLAQDIGLDADDAEGLERAVRDSAAAIDRAGTEASDHTCLLGGGTDIFCAGCACNAPINPSKLRTTRPSVLDELELALRKGAILTLGASESSLHSILETHDGERFAEHKGVDLLGVLLELMIEWKHAKPKPPPACLFCSAPLEGMLIGLHLEIGHSVPICVGFAAERSRNSCIPPHAVHQLLSTEIRKRRAAAR